MAHSSISMTLAPCLSQLGQTYAPFCGKGTQVGYLALDVAMNHVDIEFHERRSGSQPVIVDHLAGRVLLEMPERLTGVMADLAFFDERGLTALKHLVFSSDHTDAGVAVRSPRMYSRYLAFLLARVRDFASLVEGEAIDAMGLSMSQLSITGINEAGASVRNFSSASSFFDRQSGLLLDGPEALGAAIEIRARASQAHGIYICGLDERLQELMEVTVSTDGARASNNLGSTLPRAEGCRTFSSFLKQLADTPGGFTFEYSSDVIEAGKMPAGDISNAPPEKPDDLVGVGVAEVLQATTTAEQGVVATPRKRMSLASSGQTKTSPPVSTTIRVGRKPSVAEFRQGVTISIAGRGAEAPRGWRSQPLPGSLWPGGSRRQEGHPRARGGPGIRAPVDRCKGGGRGCHTDRLARRAPSPPVQLGLPLEGGHDDAHTLLAAARSRQRGRGRDASR